jgi:hypothetical protein
MVHSLGALSKYFGNSSAFDIVRPYVRAIGTSSEFIRAYQQQYAIGAYAAEPEHRSETPMPVPCLPSSLPLRLLDRTLPPSTQSYVVVPFLNPACTWVLGLQTIPISLSSALIDFEHQEVRQRAPLSRPGR